MGGDSKIIHIPSIFYHYTKFAFKMDGSANRTMPFAARGKRVFFETINSYNIKSTPEK